MAQGRKKKAQRRGLVTSREGSAAAVDRRKRAAYEKAMGDYVDFTDKVVGKALKPKKWKSPIADKKLSKSERLDLYAKGRAMRKKKASKKKK